MSKADDDGRGRAVAESLISRRNFIIAAMAGGLTLSELVSAIGGSDGKGTLWGGTLALSNSFNVAGDLYIGPDSTKSNVDANSGRVFLASDTQEVFYGDSGTWVSLGTIGGGGSAIEVQEDGSALTTDATLLDFRSGITATEPAADEIDLDIDESVLKDGGAKEIDVADLAGALGNANEVPLSDGAAVTWSTVPNAGLVNSAVTVAGNTVALGASTAVAHGDLSDAPEEAHHPRGGYSRSDVTSTSVTASPWDSLWVDTATAGAAVTVTLPADGDTSDGDRVEVGVEDATNDTDVSANTGQSIIGTNQTLTNVGDTMTLEYKSSNSTWMVR